VLHDKSKGTAKEKHKKGGDYVKSIIYGGLDGIITIFSVIAGAAGAGLSGEIVLIMGISSLLADAISMGVGDYISDRAENDYAQAEQKREEWEYENYPQGEIDEMIEIYQKKGLNLNEAKELVTILSHNKKNFIDTMMVEELGLIPPDPDDSPFKSGLVTFASFVFFGLIPMLPYIIGVALGSPFMNLFIAACLLTAFTQFALGAITSRFTIISWWKGGLYMLLVGIVASGVSYATALIVIIIVGKEAMCIGS